MKMHLNMYLGKHSWNTCLFTQHSHRWQPPCQPCGSSPLISMIASWIMEWSKSNRSTINRRCPDRLWCSHGNMNMYINAILYLKLIRAWILPKWQQHAWMWKCLQMQQNATISLEGKDTFIFVQMSALTHASLLHHYLYIYTFNFFHNLYNAVLWNGDLPGHILNYSSHIDI